MLTIVVCVYFIPEVAHWANLFSPGDYPNAQIPQEFLGNPHVLELQPDKEAFSTLVPPVQFYVLYNNSIDPPLIPYSWDLIHGSEWQDIELVPTRGKLYFDRWIQLALGFGVFVFFGLGHDAKAMYRKWLLKTGFGRIFPGLHRQSPPRAVLPTSNQTNSFGSKTRSFFKDRLFRLSMLSL